MLGSADSEVRKLIIRNFFQGIPTRVITIHQRHRQTERRTTYHGNNALRYASHGKNVGMLSGRIADAPDQNVRERERGSREWGREPIPI